LSGIVKKFFKAYFRCNNQGFVSKFNLSSGN